jgi:valyl-tRNA synthetase
MLGTGRRNMGENFRTTKKLGASCDWERTKFTMDPDMSASVIHFLLICITRIYQDIDMVNWDPEAKTTLSDEEVVYEEQQGKLYFLKYKIEGRVKRQLLLRHVRKYLEIVRFVLIQMMNVLHT